MLRPVSCWPVCLWQIDIVKMSIISWHLLLISICPLAWAAEPTPLDQPLPAGQITLIAASSIYGIQQMPGWPADGLFHYRLYVPVDYYQQQRKYPLMFIASPAGNAEMGHLEERLRRDRWLVVMLVESRNRSILWNPNFIAAYDDVMQRVRVQKEMLFCTGLSGAARVCGTFPAIRPGFQGLILQAAGFLQRPEYLIGPNADITVYGTFGRTDPNLPEIVNIRRVLPPHTRRLFEVWEGGHNWASVEVINRALQWSEDIAVLATEHEEDVSDMYHWYFLNRLNEAEETNSAIEKLRLNQRLLTLAERWQLELNESVLIRLRTLGQVTKEQAKSSEMLRKLAAYKKYAS